MSDGTARSNRARRPRIDRILIALAIVVAVIVLGVLFTRSIAARLSSARKLDKATSIAKQADTVVVAIDGEVRAPLDQASGETKALAAKQIPKAQADLRRVVALSDEAYEALNDDERKQARLLRATAAARLEMLALAKPILQSDAQAVSAASKLSAGWDELLAAKMLSRDAAAQYNKLTRPAVLQSNRLLPQVRSRLGASKTQFAAAAQAFPSLDTRPYITYVATLGLLNNLAIKSNTAWLKGQPAQANVYTTQYNTLEKQALKEAADLPQSPNKAISEAYDTATKAELQAYIAARKKATAADKALKQL